MNKPYPKGSQWRRWDLQVQTILDDGYIELKKYYEELKSSFPVEWEDLVKKIGSEEQALKYDSKQYFFTDSTDNEKTRAANYAKIFIAFLESFQKEEVCIAITDHNYDHRYLLDALIQAAEKSSVSIIGGVEINVQGVHMLALFGAPLYGKATFSEGIQSFLTKIGVDTKLANGALTVSNSSYKDVIDLIEKDCGILIYPHCNSSNGLFQERGKTDRTHLSDQFNYSEFNILQGKNGFSGTALTSFISRRCDTLKSNYCYLTATDARSLRDILAPDDDGKYTWIKADPTFEGLRQIQFEPERVSVQVSMPEDKAGYQVIDRIEISNNLILNTDITLNANMNSIIGGRSTGKSVLLTAIAQKLKTEEPITFPNKPDYEEFVDVVSSSISVIWRDGEINNSREIEFFQQGYMYSLALDKSKLSQLVQDILRNKGKSSYLESYSAKKSELKKSISNYINDLFQVISEIEIRSVHLSEKGDNKGVEDEIKRLEKKLKELDSLSLTDPERENYLHHKKLIEDYSQNLSLLAKDIKQIERLKSFSLIREDLDMEMTTLSDINRGQVENLYESIISEVQQKWSTSLAELASTVEKILKSEEDKIEQSKKDQDYIKASKAYENSAQLSELQDRIKEQKNRLFEIVSISKEISELEKQKAHLRQKVLDSHFEYFKITESLLPNLSDSQDGLDIKAKSNFDVKRYCSILEGSLNLQTKSGKDFLDFKYQNDEQYKTELVNFLDALISNSVSLKGGYTEQSLITTLLTECFYLVSYDLVYENDSFDKMSDGKKAFVVLKLLLDFSDKQCPILIDQPEDDLDNRAIYMDLVQYLKKKKVERQIIVATHNPNIVVGADSELVIVANQHGTKNENLNSKKFAYVTGSLENSSTKDFSNKIVLNSQGIREHVCEILEGGDTAFKLREKKYSLI